MTPEQLLNLLASNEPEKEPVKASTPDYNTTPAMLTEMVERFSVRDNLKVGDFVVAKAGFDLEYKLKFGLVIEILDTPVRESTNVSSAMFTNQADIVVAYIGAQGDLIKFAMDSRYLSKLNIDPHSTDTFKDILKAKH